MKKILFISILLLFPIIANAEECTEQMISSYSSQVSQIKFEPKQLGNSSTYEVWVSNIPNALAVEKGRTVTDSSGFLGYATSGQSYIARVYIADGGVCAGKTVKEVSVNIPTVKTEDTTIDNTSNNNSTSDNKTNNNETSDNKTTVDTSTNETTTPVINQTTPIQKPSVDNNKEDKQENQTNSKNEDKTDSKNEENKEDVIISDDDKEQAGNEVVGVPVDEDSSLLDTSTSSEKIELDNLKDTNEDVVIQQIIMYSLISIIVVSTILIIILKYRKRKGHQ